MENLFIYILSLHPKIFDKVYEMLLTLQQIQEIHPLNSRNPALLIVAPE